MDTAPHESGGEQAGAQETALNSAGQRQTKARSVLWELDAASSSLATPTMRSVLIGFEYPIKDTLLFYALNCS